MKKLIYLFFAAILCFSNIVAYGDNTKVPLKVLYVGGSSDFLKSTPEGVATRTASYENFLKRYFTVVKVVNGLEYKKEMSANYDVTIFDWIINPSQQQIATKDEKGRRTSYKARYLSEDFEYPAMFIAENGEALGRSIGTKTDWYCLCLLGDALNINTEHPIFKGPFKTKITLEDKPTPEPAYAYKFEYEGVFPDTVKMWKVQTKSAIDDYDLRIGMVARPGGFLDSPEAEVISGGVSQKSLDAVAIARHGNFFYWGFVGSPDYLTEEAKLVFANAVVYTAGLKGQKIIARKYFDRAPTRDHLKLMIFATSEGAYHYQVNLNENSYKVGVEQKELAKAKLARGEKLKSIEEQFFNANPVKPEPIDKDAYMKDIAARIGPKFGGDTAVYHKFLKDNKSYFYGARMFNTLEIDEDVKSLGIANTDIKLLDKAISMLEKGEDVEKAKRILDRYTLCTFETPKAWREWFEKYKDKIFFTESGGWYFMVNTFDSGVPGNDYAAKEIYKAAKNFEMPASDNDDPVAVAAKHIIVAGGRQYIVVKFGILEGYHIYGNIAHTERFIPTSITLTLPDGFTQEKMLSPQGIYYSSAGTTIYEKNAVFAIPIEGSKKGTFQITCKYQCCDKNVCLPPIEKNITLNTIF